MVPARVGASNAGHDFEVRVLLACAGSHPAAASLEAADAPIRSGLDWPRLIALARAHGVVPLLYRNLHQHFAAIVPAAIADQLRAEFHGIAWRNLRLTKELLGLLDLFRTHGIDVVPFKGPVLAALAYGDISCRSYADLDVLVCPEDALRAKDLLSANGYWLDPPMDHRTAAAQLHAEREHHFTLQRAGGTPIELHWRVFQHCYAVPLDRVGLRDRLSLVPLNGTTVKSFSPRTLVLLLCVHGAKHAWSRLGLVADLDALVRAHPDLDWDAIVAEAEAVHARRLLHIGLGLARDLFATPVPADAFGGAWADAETGRLVDEAMRRLRAGLMDPLGFELADDGAFFVQARERWRDRVAVCAGLEGIPKAVPLASLSRASHIYIRFLRTICPNDRDRETIHLPRALAAGYYLVRPLRLLGKALAGRRRRS